MSECENKLRADVALVQKGLCESRSRAQSAIAEGKALLNGKVIKKPSECVLPSDLLELQPDAAQYVSRGELKLEKVISEFHADLQGKICIDIGASTGGFTNVCLKNGAAHVYAVDVGSGQFSPRLKGDTRVTLMENTNARFLTPSQFCLTPEIAVMDVSFISIKLILPVLFRLLGDTGKIYTLIKPQFEAGRENIGKSGVIKNSKLHAAVLWDISAFVAGYGFGINQLTFSPVSGGDGNIEFLAEIAFGNSAISKGDISRIVEDAHREILHNRA